jgi:hypothetical protein
MKPMAFSKILVIIYIISNVNIIVSTYECYNRQIENLKDCDKKSYNPNEYQFSASKNYTDYNDKLYFPEYTFKSQSPNVNQSMSIEHDLDVSCEEVLPLYGLRTGINSITTQKKENQKNYNFGNNIFDNYAKRCGNCNSETMYGRKNRRKDQPHKQKDQLIWSNIIENNNRIAEMENNGQFTPLPPFSEVFKTKGFLFHNTAQSSLNEYTEQTNPYIYHNKLIEPSYVPDFNDQINSTNMCVDYVSDYVEPLKVLETRENANTGAINGNNYPNCVEVDDISLKAVKRFKKMDPPRAPKSSKNPTFVNNLLVSSDSIHPKETTEPGLPDYKAPIYSKKKVLKNLDNKNIKKNEGSTSKEFFYKKYPDGYSSRINKIIIDKDFKDYIKKEIKKIWTDQAYEENNGESICVENYLCEFTGLFKNKLNYIKIPNKTPIVVIRSENPFINTETSKADTENITPNYLKDDNKNQKMNNHDLKILIRHKEHGFEYRIDSEYASKLGVRTTIFYYKEMSFSIDLNIIWKGFIESTLPKWVLKNYILYEIYYIFEHNKQTPSSEHLEERIKNGVCILLQALYLKLEKLFTFLSEESFQCEVSSTRSKSGFYYYNEYLNNEFNTCRVLFGEIYGILLCQDKYSCVLYNWTIANSMLTRGNFSIKESTKNRTITRLKTTINAFFFYTFILKTQELEKICSDWVDDNYNRVPHLEFWHRIITKRIADEDNHLVVIK